MNPRPPESQSGALTAELHPPLGRAILHEMKVKGKGLIIIPGAAGADEVGRGALAGPLVCAAVLLPEGFDPIGLDDSKKLTEAQRQVQTARIKEAADWAVCFIDVEEVDKINVLQASLQGMLRSCLALKAKPTLLLVDGRDKPNVPGIPVEAHIKGDGTFAAIAAASILAKTARDDYMKQTAKKFPGYGFEDHVGYAAPVHLTALKQLGPCAIHRRSFEPVKSMLNQPCLTFDD